MYIFTEHVFCFILRSSYGFMQNCAGSVDPQLSSTPGPSFFKLLNYRFPCKNCGYMVYQLMYLALKTSNRSLFVSLHVYHLNFNFLFFPFFCFFLLPTGS